MLPRPPRIREKHRARRRETRRMVVSVIVGLPFALASFIGLVLKCSTGDWSAPSPKPEEFLETGTAVVGLIRAVSGVSLLIAALAVWRFTRDWFWKMWNRINRRARR